jgi:hypothetical protein
VITKNELNDLQKKKLYVAASILHKSASLFDGNTSLLPLWGGGVISHGIPKNIKCVIGITNDAEAVDKKDRAKDHLYRVTETARYVINKINTENLSIHEIEETLLSRSALMITTRTENNKKLKSALRLCENKDSWEELYSKAGIKYRLY